MKSSPALPVQAVPAKVLGVALVVAVVASSFFALHSGPVALNSSATLHFAIARDWSAAAILMLIVRYWERLPYSSLGFYRLIWRDLPFGVGGFIVGIFAFGIGGLAANALHLGTTQAGIEAIARIPFPTRFALLLTTGITEEVMFRGFLFERVAALARSVPAGALVSLTVFSLGHLSGWGLGGALQITLWTAIVTLIYARTRRLLPCIIMHVLNDGFAFFLAPVLFLHR